VGTTTENTMTAIKDGASQTAARGLRVLLVDDDQEDSFLFETQISRLKEYKIDLVWTNDYEDALRRMRGEEFDCHFVDFRLGRGSGMELISRALEQDPDKSIVLLTGFGDENVQAESLRRGAVAYLSKADMNASRLQRCIRACTADRDRGARIAANVDSKLIDEVTGAYKLETFLGAARKELDAERGSALQQVVLSIEIDAGEVSRTELKQIAETIRSCLRRSDMLGRCSERSFCVLTQSWDSWMALELAEQIRIAVEHNTEYTVTIGGARAPSDKADADVLMKRAADTRKSARQQGSNRVEVAQS
jgi:PleD family two-component response regulator